MKISHIMSPDPVMVSLDDRLEKVKQLFDTHFFHHLLVVDAGQLCGIISDRDVLRWISPNIESNRVTVNDLSTLDIPVHRVVTRKPITLGPDDRVRQAVSIFTHNRISCIPVVDAAGTPVGIVSWRDILKHFDELLSEQDLGSKF